MVGRAGLGALDQHVGSLHQLPEPFHVGAAFAGAEVEHDALLPPVPGPREPDRARVGSPPEGSIFRTRAPGRPGAWRSSGRRCPSDPSLK